MAPDIQYHLSHDAYDRFTELLAPHGITVRDTAPNPAENLENDDDDDDDSVESRSGVLIHRGYEFSYSRQKNLPDDFWHFLSWMMANSSARVFRDGHLSVTVLNRPMTEWEPLADILNQLFPDPPRPSPPLHSL
jgi:hypothetical protein